MWPFRKRKQAIPDSASTKKAVPKEVQEYYASEHRERVGLAWLIAFVSLIVTVLIIAGLFFGGRWIYRKISHKNSGETTSQNGSDVSTPPAASSPKEPSQPSGLQPTAPPPTNGGNISTPPDNSSSSSSNNSSSNSSSSSKSSSSSSSSSQSHSTPTTTTTGTAPNTGPGNTIAVFVGVTILATFIHQQYQRRKQVKNS